MHHRILLNGKPLESDFVRSYHPETDQLGLICYLDAKDFTVGNNSLEIKKDIKRERTTHWTIPFHYYPKN